MEARNLPLKLPIHEATSQDLGRTAAIQLGGPSLDGGGQLTEKLTINGFLEFPVLRHTHAHKQRNTHTGFSQNRGALFGTQRDTTWLPREFERAFNLSEARFFCRQLGARKRRKPRGTRQYIMYAFCFFRGSPKKDTSTKVFWSLAVCKIAL